MKLSPSMLTLIDTASETVKQSMTHFVENSPHCNRNELSSGLVSELTIALMESLREAGRRGLGAFIESHESPETEIVRDGRTYRLKDEACGKKFLTLFGEVGITRRYYHCDKGGKGLAPLDESWKMDGRYATPEVVERVLWTSAALTPSESSDAFARLAAFQPSVSCIQDIIGRDGKRLADMLGNETEDGIACRRITVPEGTEAFVASLDGANVLLRGKGKKRGRKAKRPGAGKKAAEEGEMEDGQDTGYRNAMVGSFSSYARCEKVIDMETGLVGLVPHRLESVYCARMPERGAAGFKGEFEAIIRELTPQLPPMDEGPRFLLLDGARPLWKYVENNPLFAGYRMLIDFYHSSEHLSKLAAGLFGEDSDESREWYEKWRSKLKYEEGGVGKMLRSAQSHAKRERRSKSQARKIESEMTYFKRNKGRMNYSENVANGWPIGSGPVEAACKSIVKARLCQSGMRWTKEGGRNILALRVLHKSEQWDHAWATYQAKYWQHAA